MRTAVRPARLRSEPARPQPTALLRLVFDADDLARQCVHVDFLDPRLPGDGEVEGPDQAAVLLLELNLRDRGMGHPRERHCTEVKLEQEHGSLVWAFDLTVAG